MNVSARAPFAGVLAIVITLFLGGCSDSGPTQPVEPWVHAGETSIFLAIGESRTISIATVPTNPPFEASSDDTEVSTVSRSATTVTITGVSVEFATVTLNLPRTRV